MQVNVTKLSRHWLPLLLILLLTNTITAQNVGIGTTNPNPNAQLEISSANRGFLAPRMDSVSRKNIPATKGLLVFDTTTNCYWNHTGTAWVNMPVPGSNAGELLYWTGNRWAALPRGVPGQYLTVSVATSLPVWTGVGTIILTTNAASGITQTTAASGGMINSDGGAAITARGVVWSTAPNPTIALPTKTNDGSGMGSFSSGLTGLIAGYTYYVRAYATNANGTSYGSQVSFVTTGTGTYTLGQAYGGGIVFYIDATGQHGLIAAPSDQSINIPWTITSTGIIPVAGASGLAIGTGAANTTNIINVQGNGSYAATLCRQFYNGGGFTDWHLPSLYELNQLFLQRNLVGGFETNGFSPYWSSSELDSNNAWAIDFSASGPNQSSMNKQNGFNVRAVRAF